MESLDAVKLFSGLQLLPENAAQLAHLQHAVAESVGSNPEQVAAHLDDPAAFAGSLEPAVQVPLPGLHCAELVIPGGAYRVFPGIHEDEHWAIEVLLGPMLEQSALPSAVTTAARRLGEAVLAISEAVAERVDAVRNSEPEHRPGSPIHVPERRQREQLAAAVSFNSAELAELAGGGWAQLLTPLTTDVERLAAHGDAVEAKLRMWPLLEQGEGLVVAGPDALLPALRHEIVMLALRDGMREELAEFFLLETSRWTVELLGRLGMTIYRPPPEDPRPQFDRVELLFLSDLDKELHLVVLADDFEDYDDDDPVSVWRGSASAEDLEARLKQVAGARLSSDAPPNEVIHLVVSQGAGRPLERIVGQATEFGDLRVVLSATELDAVARCERADPRLIWDFARDAAEARGSVQLMPTSQLEEWAFWRKNRRSFSPLLLLASEHGGRGAIIGEARLMRIEFAFKQDPHGAQAPDGRFVRVLDYLEDERVPIAQVDAAPLGTADLIVEGLPFELWVITAGGVELERVHEYLLWTELVAYWLWQLAPSLEGLLTALRPLGPVSVTVALVEGDGAPDPWRVGVADTRTVAVEIGEASMDALEGDDNAGERRLMREILVALRSLTTEASGGLSTPDEEELEAAVEARMSPPTKRKLVPIVDHDPGFEALSFPERYVSDAASMRLRREVGREAAERLGLEPGRVPRVQVHALLNTAVESLFKRLEALVASLDPVPLLEWTVSLNERLLHEETLVPSQLAIAGEAFGPDSAFARLRRQTAAEISTASVASRFLIEYLAARPPCGLRPVSYEVHDRLLAACALITTLGTSSDLVREGLAEVSVLLMPTGEVFDDRGDFSEGMGRFYELARAGELARASSWMSDRVVAGRPAEEEPDAGELFAEVDEAMVVETGHGLSELMRALVSLSNLDGFGGGAICVPRSEAVALLQRELGWDEEKSRAVIAYFSLVPRPDFTRPPAGLERRDIWPWRFNRRLSYLRKPLIERASAERSQDPDLVFGVRQLYNTSLYLEMLISHGNLEVSSKQMRDFMSRAQKRESDAFNEQLASLYRADSRPVVPNLEKLEGERLRGDDGNDLGDIDVLVGDLATRTLLCVEAKRLSGALAPHQLRNQIDRAFGESDEKPSHARKHLKRVKRIEELKDGALAELGIVEDAGDWSVEGIVVTDVELLSPFVAKVPLPVRSYEQIQAALSDGSLY